MTDDPAADLGPVTLREIGDANRAVVTALKVAPSQEGFVDGVESSLAEAAAKPHAKPWHRAIYAGEVPVGFVMLSDGVGPGDPDWPWPYYLWRYLIDERFQRHGYGRAGLDLLVAYLKTRPGAEVLMTSIVPGPGSPLDFYVRYGFRPTGERFGHEELLELRLS